MFENLTKLRAIYISNLYTIDFLLKRDKTFKVKKSLWYKEV